MGDFVPSKLRNAREKAGLTQEALGRDLGLSSEYISLLESGKRTPSLGSLSKIAARLQRDMSFFLDDKEHAFKILFRAASLDDGAREALRSFEAYGEDYLRREEAVGRHLELAPLYTNVSPERMAAEERRRTGLGDEPIRDIFAFCERNGLRILRRPLPSESGVSAVFIYIDARSAAFALINSSQPLCRQTFSAAHEYCHYLKDRHEAPVVDSPEIFGADLADLQAPREKFAQEFAAHFLMPPTKVREIAQKDFGGGSLAYEDALAMKRYFGVSAEAMLRSLQDLGLIGANRFEEYLARDHVAREREIFGVMAEEWISAPITKRNEARAERGLGENRADHDNSKGVILSDRYRLLRTEKKSKKGRP